MRALFIATSVVTFAVSLIGMHVLSKKVGKKEAVNTLRNGQLDQAKDEYKAQVVQVKLQHPEGTIDHKVAAANADLWYAREVHVINEMYDEIVNNG